MPSRSRLKQCPLCTFKPCSKKMMERHLCIHFDYKAFCCKSCNESFYSNDDLIEHCTISGHSVTNSAKSVHAYKDFLVKIGIRDSNWLKTMSNEMAEAKLNERIILMHQSRDPISESATSDSDDDSPSTSPPDLIGGVTVPQNQRRISGIADNSNRRSVDSGQASESEGSRCRQRRLSQHSHNNQLSCNANSTKSQPAARIRAVPAEANQADADQRRGRSKSLSRHASPVTPRRNSNALPLFVHCSICSAQVEREYIPRIYHVYKCHGGNDVDDEEYEVFAEKIRVSFPTMPYKHDQCQLCEKQCTQGTKRNHVQDMHYNHTIACPFCGDLVKSKLEITRHMEDCGKDRIPSKEQQATLDKGLRLFASAFSFSDIDSLLRTAFPCYTPKDCQIPSIPLLYKLWKNRQSSTSYANLPAKTTKPRVPATIKDAIDDQLRRYQNDPPQASLEKKKSVSPGVSKITSGATVLTGKPPGQPHKSQQQPSRFSSSSKSNGHDDPGQYMHYLKTYPYKEVMGNLQEASRKKSNNLNLRKNAHLPKPTSKRSSNPSMPQSSQTKPIKEEDESEDSEESDDYEHIEKNTATRRNSAVEKVTPSSSVIGKSPPITNTGILKKQPVAQPARAELKFLSSGSESESDESGGDDDDELKKEVETEEGSSSSEEEKEDDKEGEEERKEEGEDDDEEEEEGDDDDDEEEEEEEEEDKTEEQEKATSPQGQVTKDKTRADAEKIRWNLLNNLAFLLRMKKKMLNLWRPITMTTRSLWSRQSWQQKLSISTTTKFKKLSLNHVPVRFQLRELHFSRHELQVQRRARGLAHLRHMLQGLLFSPTNAQLPLLQEIDLDQTIDLLRLHTPSFRLLVLLLE